MRIALQTTYDGDTIVGSILYIQRQHVLNPQYATPESTLKKKSNAICYHTIRESVAMGECLMGHIGTDHNSANTNTKVLPGGAKQNYLTGLVLYDLTDYK